LHMRIVSDARFEDQTSQGVLGKALQAKL